MEANVGPETPRRVQSYDEFEPFCKWQREESRDTLVVHVPEFKKEQLRVQLNNRGILKVSGERSLDEWRKSKFYKEIEVPKNCNTNGIQAKFANGCLYILMPKLSPPIATPEQNKPSPHVDDHASPVDDHENPNSKSNINNDPIRKLARVDENQEKIMVPPPTVSPFEKTSREDVAQLQRSVSSIAKNCGKMAVNAGLIVTALAILAVYFFYMYRSIVDEA